MASSIFILVVELESSMAVAPAEDASRRYASVSGGSDNNRSGLRLVALDLPSVSDQILDLSHEPLDA